jgi:tetratricopeptide (TPR) repeat protein
MRLSLDRHRAVLVLVTAMLCLGSFPARADQGDELDQRIAGLIQHLGDKDYPVRQRAQQELARLGFVAFDALSDAEQSDDIEIATQAKYLVRLIRADWTNDNAPPQVKQLLRNYDFQNETSRLACMKSLVDLPGDSGLEWLCRLVRFEQSPVLSKQAALLIIAQEPQPDAPTWSKRSATIAKVLDRSTRPAARWLKTYVQMHTDPQAALATWAEMIATEQKTLDDHPQQSDVRVVIQLLRVEVDQLQAQQRDEEAQRAMREMVALERGEPQGLTELVNWLAKRRAWAAIDDVATKFASSFEGSAQLLYTLGQALQAEGKTDAAEETARKALELNPERVVDHYQMAQFLQTRGLLDWSDREARLVMEMKGTNPDVAIRIRHFLAENLHDRQRDEEAGEVLQGAVDILAKIAQPANEDGSSRLDALRSRTCYLLALGFEHKNDRVKQRELLEKAISEDPNDADVLIALYHLPDQNDEQRANVLELINASVQATRNKIDEDQDLPTPYNQLAWLVANTEGDFDEALQKSLKSVELVRARLAQEQVHGGPDAAAYAESLGGHLDTLAHCYAAKKDFDNAVKCQTEATRLIPHSQQILRKLEQFRKSQSEQQNQAQAEQPTQAPAQ